MSVAFLKEDSAEAAQEVSLPPRPVSPYPNLVTASGQQALIDAEAAARAAVGAAEAMEAGPDRRHALEAALRDLEYFSERVRSAELRPAPADAETVQFGAHSDDPARRPPASRPFASSARTRPIRAPARSPMSPRSPRLWR